MNMEDKIVDVSFPFLCGRKVHSLAMRYVNYLLSHLEEKGIVVLDDISNHALNVLQPQLFPLFAGHFCDGLAALERGDSVPAVGCGQIGRCDAERGAEFDDPERAFLVMGHEGHESKKELTYVRAFQLFARDNSHTPPDSFAFGRTRRTVVQHIQFAAVGFERFAAPFDVRETVIDVLVAHEKADEVEQIGRMDSFARSVPRREDVAHIRPYTIQAVHSWLKTLQNY